MPRQLPTSLPPPQPRISSLGELGALVRHRRLKQQLRIDDAASFCGVSANLLSRLENGRPVQTDKLLLVLSGLGLGMILGPKAVTADIEIPAIALEGA
ncbi:helix-turn-helix domain-containing protein [Cupriavidus basilensis]|uniref:helix-turn-helix domain-containing protein n=1 Tax=Cupriavidus basilensis TaxID=68895 RepID=UPI00157AD85B|nr:helix-turn-helix transcriptional regulator [Cupriavidus basilensis]NUA29119.1 helix-turn-helix domain-containing protein [Cupriavidus basilensis]